MTKIISHRGAAGLALENSLESIKTALSLPVDGIEIDIRHTKDGKLVLLHDNHTGRVATKKLFVNNHTLADLQKVELTNGEHIQTLEDILRLVGDKQHLVLDLKEGGVAQELIRLLKRYPKATVSFSSLKYGELRALREALPNSRFVVQSHLSPTDILHTAHTLRATGVSLNKWLMNPYTYQLAKRAGLELRVYTVNHPWLAWLFSKLYPDVALYTDHPERFLAKKRRHTK